MRFLAMILLVAASSQSLLAQTCRNDNCDIAQKSGAVSGMIAGSLALRRVTVEAIENKYTRLVYSRALHRDLHHRLGEKIDPNDKLTVRLEISDEALRRERYIQQLEKQMEAISKEQKVTNVMIDGLLDQKKVAALKVQRELRAAQYEDLWRKSIRVKNGKLTPPEMKITRVFRAIDDFHAEEKLNMYGRMGYTVTRIDRLPGFVARKLKPMKNNGYLMAATAVALGLVTAEELASGHLEKARNEEMKKLQ